MQHIAYYVSGHGYAHAVRAIQVIDALSSRNPYLFFHIKTTAPEWIFSLNLGQNYLYYKQEYDIGTVQHAFQEVDKPATLQKARAMLAAYEQMLGSEVEFLREADIKLVIGDIPPIAFAAAEKADKKSVAIGNFSWDWIYESYADELPEFSALIDKIRGEYAKADLLLRLPMHGRMSAFKAVIDIPLIARRARRRAKDVRRMLKITAGERLLVLVALRPSDLKRIDFSRLAINRKATYLILNQSGLVPGMLNLPQDLMPFQELINAADVVVSKPGYGIVAECLANKTPLVYTPRKDFPEYDVLVEAMKLNAVCAYIPPEQFFAGEWDAAIAQAVHEPWKPAKISSNGAAVAAGHILSLLNGEGVKTPPPPASQLSLLKD